MIITATTLIKCSVQYHKFFAAHSNALGNQVRYFYASLVLSRSGSCVFSLSVVFISIQISFRLFNLSILHTLASHWVCVCCVSELLFHFFLRFVSRAVVIDTYFLQTAFTVTLHSKQTARTHARTRVSEFKRKISCAMNAIGTVLNG